MNIYLASINLDNKVLSTDYIRPGAGVCLMVECYNNLTIITIMMMTHPHHGHAAQENNNVNTDLGVTHHTALHLRDHGVITVKVRVEISVKILRKS